MHNIPNKSCKSIKILIAKFNKIYKERIYINNCIRLLMSDINTESNKQLTIIQTKLKHEFLNKSFDLRSYSFVHTPYMLYMSIMCTSKAFYT